MSNERNSVAALRAYLHGDMDEFGSISESLSEVQSRELASLIPAAFFTAAEKRFSLDDPRPAVIEFVTRIRLRSDRVAAALDPRVAERLLLAVVSDEEIDDIDGDVQAAHYGPLLAGLVHDAQMSNSDLDNFLLEAHGLAMTWLDGE